MKKIIRLSENDLVKVMKNIISENFNANYGVKGKSCFSFRRKKDGSLISGGMTDCGNLDSQGVWTDEALKRTYGSNNPSLMAFGLLSDWTGKFRTKQKPAKTNEDLDLWVANIKSVQDLDALKSNFEKRLQTWKFGPEVTKKPTFGEAVAYSLGVDTGMNHFNIVKNHLNKLGIPMLLGKSASGDSEVIFDKSGSAQYSGNKFCPQGYKKCSNGTYSKCCSSQKIMQAQKCLGILKPDGKWGPITQNKLKSKFPQFANSFTDSDIATICG